jgi:hypothetical protein
MKGAKITVIAVMLSLFLLFSPTAFAQDDEEEDTSADACIFSTFCVIMFFIFFLVYFSSRRRTRDNQQYQTTGPPGYPPRQPGYRYPMPPTYQPPGTVRGQVQQTPKAEVKCDLCGSKNLRVFEDGYYKCNDCRHVFYHTETSRRRR